MSRALVPARPAVRTEDLGMDRAVCPPQVPPGRAIPPGEEGWGGSSVSSGDWDRSTEGFTVPKRPAGFSAFGQKPNAYASKTSSPAPSFGKQFTVQKAGSLDYKAGDRVRHIKIRGGNRKEYCGRRKGLRGDRGL